MVGGVSHAEMLERSNLVAVVGGGQAPKYPDKNGEEGTAVRSPTWPWSAFVHIIIIIIHGHVRLCTHVCIIMFTCAVLYTCSCNCTTYTFYSDLPPVAYQHFLLPVVVIRIVTHVQKIIMCII